MYMYTKFNCWFSKFTKLMCLIILKLNIDYGHILIYIQCRTYAYMTYWQVKEVCEVGLGKEGRLFKLHKDEPLTIGGSNVCKLQLNVSLV